MAASDIALLVLAVALFAAGLVGCIVPGIPGTPLCFAGLFAGSRMSGSSLGTVPLVVCLLVCIAVEILNNFVPSCFAKMSGGSRAGSIGAVVGSVAGVLTGNIFLIIFGSFLGTLVGELLHAPSDLHRALLSAWYSFLGFITGTGMRLLASLAFIVVLVKSF